MSPVDVFCPLVMLGVVCQVYGAFVVHADRRRLRLLEAEFCKEGSQVDRLLGGLRGGDDLGFAG
eukprot:913299-Pleurochrysis_carterae.AAC.1